MSFNLPLPHTCEAFIKPSNAQRNCQCIAVCGERHDKAKNLEALKAFFSSFSSDALRTAREIFFYLFITVERSKSYLKFKWT